MTDLKRDIELSRQARLDTREPKHREVMAVIVEVDGSTSAAGRPDYTWVQVLGGESSPVPVFNDTTVTVAGTPVWVEYDPKSPHPAGRIVRIAHNLALPTQTNSLSRYNVPNHGDNHQYPTETDIGPDPVLVYQPADQRLKTTGDGASLTVSVQPLIYTIDGVRKFFPGEAVDLTSYVPSTASRAIRVLLYLNPGTNNISVVEGTEVINNGVIPVPYPTILTGTYPSAYVKLVTSQTAIVTDGDVDDTRPFIASSFVGEYYTATAVGQMLYSLNGSQFAPVTPLVGDAGHILTNEDGVIIVEG